MEESTTYQGVSPLLLICLTALIQTSYNSTPFLSMQCYTIEITRLADENQYEHIYQARVLQEAVSSRT
ncbi:Putative phosphatase [Giardia duodenalis]|uniref:Putative phosphatase n=1 Tax=Giardia intestinalis TaxID=5741 RepID=V6TTP9_GIAIN|nr:Putative phosphatase [Giardia intestinalis]